MSEKQKETGLVIKFEGPTALEGVLTYNGQTIICEKLDLHIEAGEIPKAIFTCPLTKGIDVELEKILASILVEEHE